MYKRWADCENRIKEPGKVFGSVISTCRTFAATEAALNFVVMAF